jgi:hypothetical protein
MVTSIGAPSPRSEGEFSSAWARDRPAIPDPITATFRIGCIVRPWAILDQHVMMQSSFTAGINLRAAMANCFSNFEKANAFDFSFFLSQHLFTS